MTNKTIKNEDVLTMIAKKDSKDILRIKEADLCDKIKRDKKK